LEGEDGKESQKTDRTYGAGGTGRRRRMSIRRKRSKNKNGAVWNGKQRRQMACGEGEWKGLRKKRNVKEDRRQKEEDQESEFFSDRGSGRGTGLQEGSVLWKTETESLMTGYEGSQGQVKLKKGGSSRK